MRSLTGGGLAILFLTLFAFTPVSEAVEVPDPKVCDTETDEVRTARPGGSVATQASGKVSKMDQRNLCLALHPIKDPVDRTMHKDHSMYYCSLVLNRDMQNYCYAVVKGNVKMCDLIVSKEVEKECLEKSK